MACVTHSRQETTTATTRPARGRTHATGRIQAMYHGSSTGEATMNRSRAHPQAAPSAPAVHGADHVEPPSPAPRRATRRATATATRPRPIKAVAVTEILITASTAERPPDPHRFSATPP